ncbi:MAG: hypothetical protein RL653_2377 [Pseudomonadota bacterium]|jgi:hypothetical protein
MSDAPEEKPHPEFQVARPSASADASDGAALERLKALSVRERMLLALRLGARMRRIQAGAAAVREAEGAHT